MELKAILITALALSAALIAFHGYTNNKNSGREHFNNFMTFNRKYGKSAGSHDDLAYRFRVYSQNMEYIKTHNAKNLKFWMAENEFTDLTFPEFSKIYLSHPIENKLKNVNEGEMITGDVDWRRQKKVSKVKNQGQCGSCWAFSTTGSMESAYSIFKNQNLEFSEQELVDCSGSYGNYGCNGGLMDSAYKYIIDNQITNENYRYTARDGNCKASKYKDRYTVSGFKYLDPIDVTGLAKAIQTQPVSVAIEVQSDFQFYSGGVYTPEDEDCGESLNHGVLAVGFKSDGNDQYFIVKNSWGASWGDNGYILMTIGSGSGSCGIANDWDVYPTI